MSQFSSVERLSYLLKVIHDKNYPDMDEIMNYLQAKDLIPTERTIQRDLKALRDLFHIEVKYSRSKRGYFLDEESKFDFIEWMRVFELFNTAKTINDTLTQSPKNLDYIDFDRTTSSIKDDLIGKVLHAVLNRFKIKLVHRSFWNEIAKESTIEPYLLKQYQNRWYVFGLTDLGDFRSYSLDRISSLEITSNLFKPKLKQPKKAFDDIVGMVYSISDIETVVLSFNAFQGNYIKSQPIHTSQKILVDDENELRVSLRVRPNYELEEQILKHGDRVRILEPEWLKDKIRKRLVAAIENY